ncbi:hypothetical protein [Microbacterium allomyrinae]|nr:hypothetical protein [Microbacterium allomyrinae]
MSEYSLPRRKGGVMKNEITMRWVALAPIALIAVAMFSQWR